MSARENASETFTRSIDYLRSVALESHRQGVGAEAALQISEAVARYQSKKCKPTFGQKLDYQRDKYKKLLDTISSLNSQVVRTDKASGMINDANRYAIETIGNPLRSGKSFGFVSVETTTSTVAANAVGVLLEVNVGPLSNSPTFMVAP